MLDPRHPFIHRVDCAKTAAPYMHRKMPIAVELPNQPTQVDVAKLLSLPRDEREKLLATLTKLGVNLGVGAAPGVGTMPQVMTAVAGVMAGRYASADEAGKPLSPSLQRARAKENPKVAAALKAGKRVNAQLDPVDPPRPRPRKPAVKPTIKPKVATKAKPKGRGK